MGLAPLKPEQLCCLVAGGGLVGALLHTVGSPVAPVGNGILWGLGAVGAAGLFLLWRGKTAGAVLALCALGLLARADADTRNVAMAGLETVLGGTLLSGWLVSRLLGVEPITGLRAVFGAALCAAGIAKIGGNGWVDGDIQARLVLERALGLSGFLQGFRLWIAHKPLLVAAGALGVWGTELCGWMLLVPALRRAYGLALLVMFSSLWLVLGIFQPGWLLSSIVLSQAFSAAPAPEPKPGCSLPPDSSKNPW